MRRALLALALLGWAGAAGAQVATDAPGLREIAARLLAGGEAGRAREMALALLARDQGDLAALLLLGRAELALGDPEAALRAARRAHAEAGDARARFTAARLAARANADLGRWTRAQVWLRRARPDAASAEAVAAVARDYRAVTARNPLSVRLSFGLAPSSNVNNGSASAFVTLPGFVDASGQPFQFEINGEGRPLSGLRVSAGATLSYRLARSERGETALEAQASGRTYVLSGDARERAPEARGSDFADATATLGVVRRWRPEAASAPSSASLTLGQTWYDTAPFVTFLQASFGRGFALGERDRLDLTEFAERTWRRQDDEAYWSLGGRLRWTRALPSGNRANLSLALRDSLTDLPDVGYDGVTLGAGYDWARPVRGLSLGVSGEADWRRYDLSRYSFDGRSDRTLRLRASLGMPRLDLYGFHPSASVEAFRTESDVLLYDRRGVTVDLGLRSSF